MQQHELARAIPQRTCTLCSSGICAATPTLRPVFPLCAGPLRVQQFQHGQSNPTFLLELPGFPQRMVLRKQPPGQLLASAHAGRPVASSRMRLAAVAALLAYWALPGT